MPKSRTRKQTNYQRIQARNRKDRMKAEGYELLRDIYREALPNRQDYPPLSHAARAAAPAYKSEHLNYQRLASGAETFVETGSVAPRQRIKTANGKTYEGQRDGSLGLVVVVREEVRKAA